MKDIQSFPAPPHPTPPQVCTAPLSSSLLNLASRCTAGFLVHAKGCPPNCCCFPPLPKNPFFSVLPTHTQPFSSPQGGNEISLPFCLWQDDYSYMNWLPKLEPSSPWNEGIYSNSITLPFCAFHVTHELSRSSWSRHSLPPWHSLNISESRGKPEKNNKFSWIAKRGQWWILKPKTKLNAK